MTRSDKPFNESLFAASGGPELITALQNNARRIRLLQAEQLDLVAALEADGIAKLAGYASTRNLLIEAIRVAPAHATKLVARAAQVTETLTPTGHTAPAPLPNVRAALQEGLLDGEHIDAITKTLKGLPDSVELGARELIEATLAATARTADPATVHSQGAILLQHLHPDGAQPEDKLADPKNILTYRRNAEGSMNFRGQIDPETAELFEKLLDKGSTPDPQETRSKEERQGDAFCDLIGRVANPKGAATAHLHVYLDLNTLTDAVGTATLESGCKLNASAVRRLACDGGFIPIVLNGASRPLDVGQTRRLVTPSQRKALVARDRGCAYPGCCNPARWAEAHHIRHFADGGPTDLDNLVLLCRRHHRVLHHSAWEVRMHAGLPEFIPPRWIDPQQRPFRNTVHLRP
jgi:hypothetical protein